MQLAVLVCALSLVLVGLLFGFNIQVSDSVVAVLNSMGAILGGVGAAVAAFISYRSAGEWRKQHQYIEIYNALGIMEEKIGAIFDAFDQVINDPKRDDVSVVWRHIYKSVFKKYSHDYNKALATLRNLTPSGLIENVDSLDLFCLNAKFTKWFIEIADITVKVKSSPNFNKSDLTDDEIKQIWGDDWERYASIYKNIEDLKKKYLADLQYLRKSL
ncbi:hypothetical protein K0W35_001199 [Vibrio parahaemolyticus]|nr:hypothetical protein [Vibrio parahaemolyticus]